MKKSHITYSSSSTISLSLQGQHYKEMTSENNRIEYKQYLTDDLEKEAVAFLNYHEGGVIYIGVHKTGTPIGVNDIDGDMLRIKDRLKNNIMPSCMGLFDVTMENIDSKDIIKITFASGTEKPYYIKKLGLSEKGIFIRVGSASEPMPIRMIESLFAKRTRHSIGKIKSPNQNLTFEQLKIYYEGANKRLNQQFTSNLELVTEDGLFNYVAYLLADMNGTSMKVAKYDGIDRVDLTENNEYGYCSLIKATKQVLDKIYIENKTLAKITPQVTPQVGELIRVLDNEMNRQEKLKLSDREHFRLNYLRPALDLEFVEMTISDKPNSRLQKYRLTEKGNYLKKNIEASIK